MIPWKINGFLLFALALATWAFPFFTSPAAAAEPNRFALGFAFDAATGDYGTDLTTDSVTTSLILGYYPTERLDLELTVPYVYQSTRTTTTSGWIRFGVRKMRVSSGSMMGSGTAAELDDSVSGLGDLLLSAGYVLVPETESVPRVRPYVQVKFPTADEDKGLGTGEFDYTLGLDLSKWLDRWYVFGGGSYVVQGDGDAFDVENFWTWEAGLGRQAGERLLPTFSLWGASTPADESSSLLEAKAKLSYRASGNTGLVVYVVKGLADGSPDWGGGGSIFFNF